MIKGKKIIALCIAGILSLNVSPAFAIEQKQNNKRFAGENRIETSIKVANEFYENNSSEYNRAILSPAGNKNLVDSLTVAPLAYMLKAPILLSDCKDTINEETLKALKDNNVKEVYISTGKGVLSEEVEFILRARGISVKRLGGENRYKTALNVFNEYKSLGGDYNDVCVVSGNSIPDALSIAPIAARRSMPILLTDTVETIAKEFEEIAYTANNIYAVGGQAVISNKLVASIRAERIYGKNRYETNSEVINRFYPNGLNSLYFANGNNNHLVDSLTASVLAAFDNGPIVLCDDILGDSTVNALNDKIYEDTKISFLGGEKFVSNDITSSVKKSKKKKEDVNKESDKEKVKKEEQLRKEQEAREKAEREVKEKEEAKRKAQEEKAKQEEELKKEQEVREKAEREAKQKEEAERKAQEEKVKQEEELRKEQEAREKVERESKQIEEAKRKAQEEKVRQEETLRKEQEVREKAEREAKQKEEAERKAQEEKAKQEEELRKEQEAREKAERESKQIEEAERKAQEEKAKQEEELRKEQEAREKAEREAKERVEAERKAQEEKAKQEEELRKEQEAREKAEREAKEREEAERKSQEEKVKRQNGSIDSVQEFKEALKNSLENFDTKVVLKVADYNKQDYDLKVLNEIVLENPEINYGYKSCEANISGYPNSTERTMTITIKYRLDKATMEMEKAAVKKKTQEVLASIITPGMNAAQKELAIYNYLIENARYNSNYDKAPLIPEDHNAYGVLIKGIGVCESYAKAMHELLTASGVETKYVTGLGNGGPHAWNMVKLDDGQWYNIDVTWDDPVYSGGGSGMVKVTHNYFNLNDEKFNKDHVRGEYEQSYPAANGTMYSADNMNVVETDKDGNEFIRVTNTEELEKAITDVLTNKEQVLNLNVSKFGTNVEEVNNILKNTMRKNNVYGGYRVGYNDNYIRYTINY
ncbi:MAG: cell wall-binding repeat-containing protein [Clostridium sp.]